MAVFSVKAAITGDETKLYHLNVLLDPASGIVDDAEVCILTACVRLLISANIFTPSHIVDRFGMRYTRYSGYIETFTAGT
jgi:hypothetical protein